MSRLALLVFQPCSDNGDYVIYLFAGERSSHLYAMPLLKTFAATGGGGMLCYEDR
jgi:hypothetical protein